uniref:Uncharacterized protein n=1 Tax=Romanomermis culicivorax TaxID=13658 RepID=A0A915KS42_ROMCU
MKNMPYSFNIGSPHFDCVSIHRMSLFLERSYSPKILIPRKSSSKVQILRMVL